MPDGTYSFVPTGDMQPEGMSVWPPLLIPRAAIEAEIERLANSPAGRDGRRASMIVHPNATAPGKGLAPGVDVTIVVLKPGESSVPIRRNSNQVEFCIRGSGVVTAGAHTAEVGKWDTWNIPAMRVHGYENRGEDLFVRLSYSNAPLLEKLGIHFVEKGDEINAQETRREEIEKTTSKKFNRSDAPDVAITEAGARMRGFEFLVDIEAVENNMIVWPWEAAKELLPETPDDKRRNIMLLYNPATERRNGTTHSFFATLAVTAPGTPPRPVGRGHKHSSVAINYHFKGRGSSIVDGKEVKWEAGDLLLSAPSWSEHAHYPGDEGHAILTVQDHPQQIGMESLIWQEKIDGPILTLGSDKGQTGYVGPRQQG